MFLRRSLAQYKYIYYFCRYIWGSCPPNTKKLATLVVPTGPPPDAQYDGGIEGQDQARGLQPGGGGGYSDVVWTGVRG